MMASVGERMSGFGRVLTVILLLPVYTTACILVDFVGEEGLLFHDMGILRLSNLHHFPFFTTSQGKGKVVRCNLSSGKVRAQT